MQIDRRNLFKTIASGAALATLPPLAVAQAGEHHTRRCNPRRLTLANGFRTHYLPNDSGYVLATLVLRSDAISHDGLAHLFEHTSCSGAAGPFTAADVTALYKDCIQDGNASTEPGMLKWYASFLPEYLPRVISLLGAITLDQKFDVETVEQQARVVLQELYLDKYDADKNTQKEFDRELFGKSHPYVKETTDAEIAKARTPPAGLAAELAAFADTVRLPANMDLFLVGAVEPAAVEALVQEHFGRYAYAEGPLLQIPQVAITHAYKGLTASSTELKRPMSDLKIAWNTGVRVVDSDARVLLALSEYMNSALFDELRDKDGDTYTPEAAYQPDSCSGVFKIAISSSKEPARVEKRIFEVIDRMKTDIDPKELARLRDRLELKRRKDAMDNQALLDRIVDRALDGCALDDLALETVTPDELLAAARKYLPSHRHSYVRLALRGV